MLGSESRRNKRCLQNIVFGRARTIVQAEKDKLKQYLLGKLTEAEEDQVELRLLSEPDYAEEFDALVYELTDQYVAGEVEGEDRDRVEQYFLKSADRQHKLRFSLALNEYAKEKNTRHDKKKSPFIPYLAIAAGILVIVGAGLGAWRIFLYQRDLDRGLIALRSAFSKERPLEARLTDFNYAPLPNQRGAPAQVDYVQRDLASVLLLKEASEHSSAASHHALGQFYLAERQFDQAIDQFKKALALDPNNAKIHSDLGAALMERARVLNSEADTGKDLELFAESLEHIRKALELDNSLLEAHFNRALVYHYMQPSKQAEAAWREYLQLDSNSPWAEEAKRKLKSLEETGKQTEWNIDDGVRDFLEARRRGDDDNAWNVVRQSYTSAGNEVTNRLLDSLFEQDTNQQHEIPGSLQDLSYLAVLESSRTKDRYTSDLVSHYKRATANERTMLAHARKSMKAGYALFTQSEFHDAIAEYVNAKLSYEQAGDQAGRALVDYRLAHCYILLSDLPKARSILEDLTARCETNGYVWLQAQSLYGLAHASASANDFSRAIDFSNQALAGFERSGDLNGVLRCMAQLADLNWSLNRSSRSFSYLKRGLTLAGEIRAEPMQRWGMLVQMASNISAMGFHAAELFYHQEALAIALGMDRPLLISRSYGYVGSSFAKLKMYPEALNAANKALETGQRLADAGGLEIQANALLQLADIHREAGDCAHGIAAYDRSIQLYGTLNQDYFSYRAHKGKLLCVIGGSDEESVRKEFRTVLGLSESYRSKITTESERNSFFDLQQSVFDLAIHFEFVRMNDQIRAFEYSEASRARSLLDMVRQGSEVLNKGFGPDLKLPDVTPAMSLIQIQEKMPGDAQILQYAVLDDRLLMWVITKSKMNYAEVRIASKELTQKIRDYLAALNTPPADSGLGPFDQSGDLYRTLIAPVEQLLDKSKFLCVVPDKALHYLPFGALFSPATSRYLIEDYDIGIAPSASLFCDLSEVARERLALRDEKLLIVDDPRFDRQTFSSLRDLPSASYEAKGIIGFYPKHQRLSGPDAREAAIRSEIATADVVHLALHYVINDKSEMLSGFPLARDPSSGDNKTDGFLQSYEIYTMSFPHARLVVLSACQTGIEQEYRGEGAVGVVRPFLAKRVPVVVASLWPVDSDASAQLMTSFHKHRIRDSLSVAKALKASQIEMARGQDARYRHPYYWAPFMAIGGQSPY